MEQLVTGVDIGTGSTKAITINRQGNVVSTTQVYYSTVSPRPGYSEQDPEIIWNAFVSCLNDTIKNTGNAPTVVSISSAMHGLLLMDEKDVAITPLITWEDTRSENIAEHIKLFANAGKIYATTGTPIHAMSPLCKIKWYKENQRKIFKRAHKFISIKEFIWHRLFNVYEVDQSIASATGLFDIRKKKWYEASLHMCDITESQLSEVVATSFTRRNVNEIAGLHVSLGTDTTFCIGASDGCLANLGSNVMSAGVASVTIGTSGAVRITSKSPVTNYPAMIFNYILDDTCFISGAPVNNGGNVIKWLFKAFLQNDTPSDEDYIKLFASVDTIEAGSNGLLFLPYLHGERAPIWDGDACGVFFGIKPFHTNAHFLRATLEGICYNLKNNIKIIEAASSSIQHLSVSGGFTHSNTWLHILADVCNKEISLARTEDASSIGAALLGMKAVGIIHDYSSFNEKPKSTITPDAKNYTLYEKYYKIFKDLYEPLKNSMHKLRQV